jgi:transcriptional regulator with PAS, ATPase and Fis domain
MKSGKGADGKVECKKGLCDHCDIYEKEKMDVLFKVMDNENDVTLTDGRGIVIRISDSYEKHYGVAKEDVVGKSIFSLEREGIFRPSVTAVVLEKKCKATILQKNKLGESIMATGVTSLTITGKSNTSSASIPSTSQI